jgi:hypothetical protein
MKTYWRVDVQIHIILTSALVEGEWSASRPDRFTLWERAPSTHWIGDWMGSRAGLDDVEKKKNLAPTETRTPTFGRLARCQSLYRLRYASSFFLGK